MIVIVISGWKRKLKQDSTWRFFFLSVSYFFLFLFSFFMFWPDARARARNYYCLFIFLLFFHLWFGLKVHEHFFINAARAKQFCNPIFSTKFDRTEITKSYFYCSLLLFYEIGFPIRAYKRRIDRCLVVYIEITGSSWTAGQFQSAQHVIMPREIEKKALLFLSTVER